MKRMLSFLVMICLVMLLAACGSSGEAVMEAAKTEVPEITVKPCDLVLPDVGQYCEGKVTFKDLEKMADGRNKREFSCAFENYPLLLDYLEMLCQEHSFVTTHDGDGYIEYKKQVAINYGLAYEGPVELTDDAGTSSQIYLSGSNERANGTVSGMVTFWSSIQLFDDQTAFEYELAEKARRREQQREHTTGDGSDDDRDSGSSWNDVVTIRCSKCSGDGEITCTNCDGLGYKVSYSSAPNYSGSLYGSKTGTTKETCYKCHGSGTITCTRCGGDGRD